MNKLRSRAVLMFSLLVAIAVAAPVRAAELSQAAVEGFDRYVRSTERRINDQARTGQFLWVDTLSSSERDQFYARLRNGEILDRKLEAEENGKMIKVPQAMFHDWISLVFVPGATLEAVKT